MRVLQMNPSTELSYICILAFCRLVILPLKFQMLRKIVDAFKKYNPFNDEFEVCTVRLGLH